MIKAAFFLHNISFLSTILIHLPKNFPTRKKKKRKTFLFLIDFPSSYPNYFPCLSITSLPSVAFLNSYYLSLLHTILIANNKQSNLPLPKNNASCIPKRAFVAVRNSFSFPFSLFFFVLSFFSFHHHSQNNLHTTQSNFLPFISSLVSTYLYI